MRRKYYKIKRFGNKIYWLNVTDVGVGNKYNEEFIEKRKIQINKIKAYYGFEKFINLRIINLRLV